MTESQTGVEKHFDSVAAEYDRWKEKNSYYYDELKSIARQWCAMAPSAPRVLDAGCGTGSILASLEVREGVGVDISPEMIVLAKQRNARPHLSFVASDIADYRPDRTFDVVLFFDVIEHVSHPRPVLDSLRRAVADGGCVVVSMANPLWEPVLMLAEKLGLKMPEGPHDRMPTSKFIEMARDAGLALHARDGRLIFPKKIPLVSYVLNRIIGRLPLIRRLSVIEVFVFTPVLTLPRE